MTDEESKRTQAVRNGLRACFIYYMRFNGSAILYREAKSLKDKGFDVDIICLRDSRKEDAFQEYEGMNLYGIQPREEREKRTSVYFARLLAFCIKATALMCWLGLTRKYDIVHVTTPPDFLVYAAFVPKLRGAKIILDIHDIGPELFMRKLHKPENGLIIKMLKYLEGKSARFSDHVITVTDLWRDKLVSRSVPADRCTSILNVPDDNLFRAYTPTERAASNKIRLSYHGSLEEHFGVDFLITAMPDIKNQIPEAELVIYGMGRIRDALEREIQEKDMGGYVRINDFVPFHALPAVLQEAAIGIVPTKSDVFAGEALSMKALEYMALGIPVVVSRTPVHDHYYDDSMVRFFVPGDRNDFIKSVVGLCRDSEARRKLAENARGFIRERGWPAERRKYYNIIDSLLAFRAAKPRTILAAKNLGFLRPLLPRRVQIAMRRAIVKWKLPEYSHFWPIDPTSAAPPEHWKGWPEGKKFALVLTHDVETARGLAKCGDLMDLEERMGFRSSFNLVIQDYEVPPEFIREARDRGFEIGIHGLKHTWDIYRSEKAFAGQAVQINKHLKQWGAKGFRSPSMLHNLDYIHHLDVDYDASTFDTDPFEPQPDGMATIFPFWVPGHNSRQRGYVELPYTLPQDFLLYVIMREKGIEIWRKKLDWIAGHGGMALFITHPDYMNFNGLKPGHSEYPYRYYEEFLHYVKTRYEGMYWQALPEDMSRFWAQNYARREERAKPPIRVCMVAYSFYELDNRVMRYAETLAKRGDSVDVIALGKPGAPGFENIRGVNVYRIQTRKIDEKGRISYLAKLFRFLFNSSIFLTKKHLSLPYDLIHVHSVPDFEVFAAVFPKLRGAKVILDIHDIVPEFYASKFREGKDSATFRILTALERLSAEFSDHVIISNHIWEKTLLSRSVDQHRCSVIMNYPDESIFYRRPGKRNDNKFIMLYPGTMGKHQGLDLAIKAFAKVKNQIPGAEFHIYGQGQEKENLLRLIAALGLENEVLVRDIIPIDRIAEVMANADLGVIPKTNDPFGGDAFSTKTLEFMSLGVPVIVSATRIDKFYFSDFVVKFFNPGDENDLAGCMLLLARDEGLRNRLRENALSFVKSYSWEKRKFEYLELVDSLTRKRHGIPQGNR